MANKLTSWFTLFAQKIAVKAGRPGAFLLAALVILIWAVLGPIFHYSDAGQLVINTGSSIVTFLMVFLIQNSQNRDSEALQIKLDEIIRSLEPANNLMLHLEEREEDELDEIRQRYLTLARAARQSKTGKQKS